MCGLDALLAAEPKLADLRLDAASAFEKINEQSTGDAVAIAELVVFETSVSSSDRLGAYRELCFALRTE
jgi:hypothetical protein